MADVLSNAIRASMDAQGNTQRIFDRVQAYKQQQQEQQEKRRQQALGELEFYDRNLNDLNTRLAMTPEQLADVSGRAMATAKMAGLEYTVPDPVKPAIMQAIYDMQRNPDLQKYKPAARSEMLRARFGQSWDDFKTNLVNAKKLTDIPGQEAQLLNGKEMAAADEKNGMAREAATRTGKTPLDAEQMTVNAQYSEAVKPKSALEQLDDELFGDFYIEDPEEAKRRETATKQIAFYDKYLMSKPFLDAASANPMMGLQVLMTRNQYAEDAGVPELDMDAFSDLQPTLKDQSTIDLNKQKIENLQTVDDMNKWRTQQIRAITILLPREFELKKLKMDRDYDIDQKMVAINQQRANTGDFNAQTSRMNADTNRGRLELGYANLEQDYVNMEQEAYEFAQGKPISQDTLISLALMLESGKDSEGKKLTDDNTAYLEGVLRANGYDRDRLTFEPRAQAPVMQPNPARTPQAGARVAGVQSSGNNRQAIDKSASAILKASPNEPYSTFARAMVRTYGGSVNDYKGAYKRAGGRN